MIIRFPYWLSTTAVAALMFAQSIVPGLAPARAPVRAPERADATTQVAAPERDAQATLARTAAPKRQAQATNQAAAKAPEAQAQTQPAASEAPSAEQPAPAPEAKGKLIMIDPGHGGTDPGAVHETADGQVDIKEEDATLAVANKLADMLRANGYEVKMTRAEDADVVPGGSEAAQLQGRVNLANDSDADLLISLHFNGIANKETRGTEVWYCADRPFSDDNEKLAQAVQDALVRSLNQAGYQTEDRGIKDDAKMGHFAINGPHINNPSEMPSITGEPLFMTNDQDAEQLQRPEVQQALAQGYFDGIQAYLGGK